MPNLADLNLYDGPDAAADLPDVILVGASTGMVRGSMVWTAETNTLSFIKTGGVLADDLYTVTLVSGQNGADPLSLGFHDATGNLDGNGNFNDTEPADNYTTNFVVSTTPGTRIVGIQDFARGPDALHSINDAPATPEGMLVRIDGATGVTSIQFQLHFNPSLLTVNGATLVAGLPGLWLITSSVTADPMNSALNVLTVVASGNTPLTGTDRPLINISAAVPNSAPYHGAEVLRIDHLLVGDTSGPIAAKADNALQKVAYYGDADGSGLYAATDAVFIQDVASALLLNPNSTRGFDSQDWTDPLIIADINQNGTVDANDASLVLQKVLNPTAIPQIPNRPPISLTFGLADIDPTLSIPSNIQNFGSSVNVAVSVSVEPSAQVYGATFDISFDPTFLAFSPPVNPQTMLGSFWTSADGWSIATNILHPGARRSAGGPVQ